MTPWLVYLRSLKQPANMVLESFPALKLVPHFLQGTKTKFFDPINNLPWSNSYNVVQHLGRAGSDDEEPVHILAYYGSGGPANADELENCLSSIREGRFLRAKEMLLKLKSLKMPIKWESLMKISGHGVAPGRVHVARAMVEAGYVENLKQAFSRYLYDGGPAYATWDTILLIVSIWIHAWLIKSGFLHRGKEPAAEEAVKLICRTGGVATLAHPWALKNPVSIIKSLKIAGLHGMEVYRTDGKLAGKVLFIMLSFSLISRWNRSWHFACLFAVFSDLTDTYDLLKLGGSDYHGRGHGESDLGSVNLPILAIHEFLKRSQPIWNNAMNNILQNFAQEPSDSNFSKDDEVWKSSRFI